MTAGRNAEDPAAAPGRDPRPGPAGPGPVVPPADLPAGPPAALDPDHPQWVRRRRKLNILFGASLATFLGVGVAAIANMVQGRPIDPYAASVMWPLGSAAAAATGLYVWQGVRRSDWGGGWGGGAWSGGRWNERPDGWRSGHR